MLGNAQVLREQVPAWAVIPYNPLKRPFIGLNMGIKGLIAHPGKVWVDALVLLLSGKCFCNFGGMVAQSFREQLCPLCVGVSVCLCVCVCARHLPLPRGTASFGCSLGSSSATMIRKDKSSAIHPISAGCEVRKHNKLTNVNVIKPDRFAHCFPSLMG